VVVDFAVKVGRMRSNAFCIWLSRSNEVRNGLRTFSLESVDGGFESRVYDPLMMR
jgi:hypothetical protein